jgi:mannosyl-3-phosphoglycerate phosphatase
MKKPVLFTDLDGTLLDATTYSFDAALPALRLLGRLDVPVVICSSKTRAEIEHYRGKLGNRDPFIPENGGAVFIPRGYFPDDAQVTVPGDEVEKHGYRVIRLGASYRDLRRALMELREEGFDVRGFGDMYPEEIASATGLPIKEAVMAGMREFDEPFFFPGGEDGQEKLVTAVKEKGFNITKGLFYHILGASDKGRAVSILIGMYRKQYGDILTVALGDSPNDLSMLHSVEHPIIVEKHDGGYDPRLAAENFEQAAGAGPEGWNRAVIKFLKETGYRI